MTAVEWLFDAVYRDMPYSELLGLLADAKIMEKQQIIDSYNSGQQIPPFDFSEQYYNETFKNK